MIMPYDEIEESEKPKSLITLCMERTNSFRKQPFLLPIMSTEIRSSKIYDMYMKGVKK